MKSERRVVIITASLSLLVLLPASSIFLLDRVSTSHKQVESARSIVDTQLEMEDELDLSGFTIENPKIIVNPYGKSPLTALIAFETESNVAPTVTIKGRDDLSTFTHKFEPSREHILPIYGLYAGERNTVDVAVGDEIKSVEITTDKLPDDMILPSSVFAQKDKLSNELYFFTPSSSGYTVAYDINGEVRWYLSGQKATWEINKLTNGRLLVSTERLINPPYYTTGLYEMDLLGKIYKEYSLEGGYHHDYFEMENGNLLVASDDFDNEAGTVEDIVVEIDRMSGKVVKQFDLKQILSVEDGKSEGWTNYDWFHNNSVWYDKKTNSITLSGRHQDAVINVDYDSGKLNWIIGDPTNWGEDYQKYFFKPIGELEWQWSQHAAMITPDGYVFLLDNGNNKSKIKENYVPARDSYTRGVMYKIDTSSMTIEQVWQYGKERGSEFYSPYISDVDYLAKGHYIVHSGGIVYKNGEIQNTPAGLAGADKLVSDTVELLNDQVIFEMKLPTNNYRVEKMNPYSINETFKLGPAKRVGSLGETPRSSEDLGFVLSSKKSDDKFEAYDINLKKEMDRLVLNGKFKRGDKVKLILYQNMKRYTHDLRISKKPYTALCVDIFTEKENKEGITVTKFVNAEGLGGKYSIYIEINGDVYDTERFVRF